MINRNGVLETHQVNVWCEREKSKSQKSVFYSVYVIYCLDEILLMLTVVYNYGWEYDQESGFNEDVAVNDFLSILAIKASFSWKEITTLINRTFERECPRQIHENRDDVSSCISLYEYGSTKWTSDHFPSSSFSKTISQRLYPISVRLKGYEENNLDDLSYSSLVPTPTLEECLRILEQEKKLMFTVNEEIEGKYIVSCIARWIKIQEEDRQRNIPCQIITIQHSECQNLMNLINSLLNLGIIYKGEERRLSQKYILILNIDTLENHGVTSAIFDWLSHGLDTKKSSHYCTEDERDDDNYLFHKDVTIISYATNNKVTCLSQQAYRLFKIISLPSIHQTLITRWLRQRIIHYLPSQAYELCMVNTVKWLSEVYQNLHKSFSKIQLVHKLPDVSVYLDAPLNDKEQLYEWVKDLWNDSLIPCVEESVRQRTSAATEAQRDLLIKATLKALFEKSIRSGCPVDLKF